MNICTANDKSTISTIHRGRLSLGAFLLTIGLNCHSIAQSSDSGSPSETAQPADSAASPNAIAQVDELEVTTRKQTALDSEAISLSDTPDAEPVVGGKTSIVVGLAAREAHVYDGSKKSKVSPFPYIDIHGLFHDRVFISDIRGIGFNVVDQGAFRAGMSVNYGGGRTSSDSPRLQGLPDIKTAAGVSGFMTYSLKPLAFELKVGRELGSQPATEVQLGASLGMAPTPRWHVSVGTQLTWHDSKFNQKYFGITPAEAAQATASGNLLTAYDPKSSLGPFGITATSVYAMTEHWGLVTRLGLRDLIGSAEKKSPLTERIFGVDFALGAIYKF
ncbi:MAG: MipA/OmpV family protein [Pseudomonadota bacterium]|nr:MipA/OmpV family protein [Pseudomonadota bacterium]